MPTQLLNDDGMASMATALLSSHHAFRRDLARFAEALRGDLSRAGELAREWKHFRETLHHHHLMEDSGIFPDLRAKHSGLAAVLDLLDDQHKDIEPMLARGDGLFSGLRANAAGASTLIAELTAHLSEHFDAEEPAITPHLRSAKEFPLPPSEEVVAVYAEGFAWSCSGLADSVQKLLFAMLPPALAARIPAALAAFDERCLHTWGKKHTMRSTTSLPGV
ncbi:MAG: hemerythrin domain-containing protein [Myxococcaceae bacterium]